LSTLDLSSFSKELRSEITALKSDMGRINHIREQVSALSISAKDEVAYYTNMNKKILHIVAISAKLANTPELVKALDSYTNFLKSKERAGIERAVLSNTFAANKFAPGMYVKFITLVAQQDAYIDAFLSIGKQEIKRVLQNNNEFSRC